MTRPSRGRRPGAPDTRAAVLAAARAAFAAKGFGGTTIRAVAADAGVDPALVHHYFGTKDDLFLAAMELPVDPREVIGAGHRRVRSRRRPSASCAPSCRCGTTPTCSPPCWPWPAG